jgi:hypothetical protein
MKPEPASVYDVSATMLMHDRSIVYCIIISRRKDKQCVHAPSVATIFAQIA